MSDPTDLRCRVSLAVWSVAELIRAANKVRRTAGPAGRCAFDASPARWPACPGVAMAAHPRSEDVVVGLQVRQSALLYFYGAKLLVRREAACRFLRTDSAAMKRMPRDAA